MVFKEESGSNLARGAAVDPGRIVGSEFEEASVEGTLEGPALSCEELSCARFSAAFRSTFSRRSLNSVN